MIIKIHYIINNLKKCDSWSTHVDWLVSTLQRASVLILWYNYISVSTHTCMKDITVFACDLVYLFIYIQYCRSELFIN